MCACVQPGRARPQAAACCKHYVAYDVEGNGPLPSRVFFDAQVDTRSFWEHYMPTFHACVQEARAAHVMCSYNSMNGVPTCADANLMDGILREQWGWPGFVVSDFDVRSSLRFEPHGRAAPNPPRGARRALLPTPSRPASEQAWANIRSTHHFTNDWVHTAAAGLNG